jgi:hypothetical protein
LVAAAIIAELYIRDAKGAWESAIIGEEVANAPEDARGKVGDIRKLGSSNVGILVGMGPVVICRGSYSGLVDAEENKSTAT